MVRRQLRLAPDFEGEILEVKVGGYAHVEYRVLRFSGHWPKDEALVRACDPGRAPFGGSVRRVSESEALVTVHND